VQHNSKGLSSASSSYFAHLSFLVTTFTIHGRDELYGYFSYKAFCRILQRRLCQVPLGTTDDETGRLVVAAFVRRLRFFFIGLELGAYRTCFL